MATYFRRTSLRGRSHWSRCRAPCRRPSGPNARGGAQVGRRASPGFSLIVYCRWLPALPMAAGTTWRRARHRERTVGAACRTSGTNGTTGARRSPGRRSGHRAEHPFRDPDSAASLRWQSPSSGGFARRSRRRLVTWRQKMRPPRGFRPAMCLDSRGGAAPHILMNSRPAAAFQCARRGGHARLGEGQDQVLDCPGSGVGCRMILRTVRRKLLGVANDWRLCGSLQFWVVREEGS
jgi:hypothetical protein